MRLRLYLGAAVGAAGLVLAGTFVANTASAGDAPVGSGPDFAAAAHEFRVPEQVLLAYSYALTSWENHGGAPSAGGGYGPLHLTAADAVEPSGRGAAGPETDRAARLRADPAHNTLDRAATLLHQPPGRLKTDIRQNIRGGAALLADEARRDGTPTGLAGWRPVISRLSGSATLADDVFAYLRTGVAHRTADGRQLRLAAEPTAPAPLAAESTGAGPAECPAVLDCRFVPAAYAWNDRSDPNAYGNYDPADRSRDGHRIRYIVIHDTEGSYDSAITTFQNSNTYTSAHYVIRSNDGAVTQMVHTKDIAWHAGGWNLNTESIGIEHEAFAVDGATWYTDQMYRSSARLVSYLAARYDIPLDRQHILGHDDVANDTGYANSHWDPGPFWDWDRYLKMVREGTYPQGGGGRLVTIAPKFATNTFPNLTYCAANAPCRTLAPQPTNFAFLRTQPRADAPLITDPVIGGGSTQISDWSDKAATGRTYAVADRSGEWLAIWYGGRKAWLKAADTRPATGTVVRTTRDDTPVYPLAFPEPSEYPAGVPAESPPRQPTPLYRIPAGQTYLLVDTEPATNYYARFDGADVPHNHTYIQGAQRYHLISFAHRLLFVKASDVDKL
jgi:hypothetical protein